MSDGSDDDFHEQSSVRQLPRRRAGAGRGAELLRAGRAGRADPGRDARCAAVAGDRPRRPGRSVRARAAAERRLHQHRRIRQHRAGVEEPGGVHHRDRAERRRDRSSRRSTFDIRWHHAGGATVDIEYSATGVAGPFQTLAAGEANDGLYEWTVDPLLFPVGDDYVIRVRSSTDPDDLRPLRRDVRRSMAPPFQVLSFTPNASGFDVRFNLRVRSGRPQPLRRRRPGLGLPDCRPHRPGRRGARLDPAGRGPHGLLVREDRRAARGRRLHALARERRRGASRRQRRTARRRRRRR